MIVLLADVNLFIYAHRPESPRFAEHHAWLTAALTADEPFGVSELILSGFLRIVTTTGSTANRLRRRWRWTSARRC